jgi:hypothetical protein
VSLYRVNEAAIGWRRRHAVAADEPPAGAGT